MKTIHAILALIFATLLVSVFSFASEEVERTRKVHIKIDQDGEAIDVEAEDLEIGETRQSFTDSGKEVLLTRTEDGFDLTVDGKKLNVGIPHGDHHSVFMHGGAAKVIIHELSGDGEGHRYSFVHGDEESHGDHHWVSKADGDHMILVERVSAAEHLQASGVLDDLDVDTRQKILDVLQDIEPRTRIKKHVVVDVQEEIHEHD